MASPQQKGSQSIVRYLIIRAGFIILIGTLLYLSVLIPLAQKKLSQLVVAQGEIFNNTTVAATGDQLYAGDFSTVVDYTMNVVSESPDIDYVNIFQFDGPALSITANQWTTLAKPPQTDILLSDIESVTQIDNPFNGEPTLKYSKIINLSGLDWGVIEVGISPRAFASLSKSISRNVLVLNCILAVGSLLIIYFASIRVRDEVFSLGKVTGSLASGDFNSRVQMGKFHEFNEVASAFNTMADAIKEQTDNISQMARVVEETSDAVLVFDEHMTVRFANEAVAELATSSHEELIGVKFRPLMKLLGMEDKCSDDVLERLQSGQGVPFSIDALMRNRQQADQHFSIRADSYLVGQPAKINHFLLMTDITERKTLEDRLNTMAFYDKLTQLPNRQLFMKHLNESVQYHAFRFALMFIDLDDFKLVNDSMGHEAGDTLLKLVAQRLQDSLRSDDLVCRLGGDEFTVLLRRTWQPDTIGHLASKLIEAVRTPYEVNNRLVHIGASIGIVTYPNDGHSVEELVKKADTAMYEAKRLGKNRFRFFTEEMTQQVTKHVHLESELRQALERDEFHVIYQPIVEIDSGNIRGVEALLRWQHPEQGEISPVDFIPIAERTGLIVQIGNKVLQQACATLLRWQDMGIHCRIGVNVSGVQLYEQDFVESVLKVLSMSKVDPKSLVLEFTESVLIERQESNLQKLFALKSHGLMLAMDDFGTGFSSLGYLSDFPIDILKIDRAFMQRVPFDAKACAIVTAVFSLSRELKLECIAEGMEHEDQHDWLCKKGGTLAQGYYFSNAISEDKITQMLMSSNKEAGISN